MPIRFQCPNPECGKTIAVKDEFAGRTGKCPGCQAGVRVPAAPVEVAADEPAPPPPKRAAVAPAKQPVAAEPAGDGDARPAGGKKPARPPKAAALRKQEAADLDDDILGRTEWYVRQTGASFGNTRAGLFESAEDEEPYAVIRDATFKLFGFINVDVAGIRPRFKFQLRRGDRNGPVLLTLERFVPRFDVPLAPKKPSRWEVRGPSDEVVGSITFSRAGFSPLKFLSKGQFFQGELCVLDADGARAGTILMERARGALAAPSRMVIVDTEGEEYGSFGTQTGKKVKEMLEESRATGKRKVSVSVSVMGEGDEDWRGVYGRVNPARTGDRYARVMTLAVAILLENLSFEAFAAARSRATE